MHHIIPYIIILIHYPFPSIILSIIVLISAYHPIIISRYLAEDVPLLPSECSVYRDAFRDICDDAVDIIFSYLPHSDKFLVTKKMYMAAFDHMDRRTSLERAFKKAGGRGLFPLMYKEYIERTGTAMTTHDTRSFGGKETFMYFFNATKKWMELTYVPDDLTDDDYKSILSNPHVTLTALYVHRI